MSIMADLTRTQRAALAELQAGAKLYPAQRGFLADPTAGHQYSTKTLQALVDAGHARWTSPPFPSAILATPRDALPAVLADLTAGRTRTAPEPPAGLARYLEPLAEYVAQGIAPAEHVTDAALARDLISAHEPSDLDGWPAARELITRAIGRLPEDDGAWRSPRDGVDDKRLCANCDDAVYALSSRDWCDGCEAVAGGERPGRDFPEDGAL